MKNRKQLLADFYLALLTMPVQYQQRHYLLLSAVKNSLVVELESDEETIKRIFTRMAEEDR